MEYEPEERRPLMRTISEDGVFDPPQTPVFYDVSKKKRRAACFVILLTEMLERLTYYGIFSNFIMFLIQDPFSWDAKTALHLFFAFTAISYIFSVIGGLIADTLLGRFKTIFFSLVIYMAGMVFFLLMGFTSAYPSRFNICGIPKNRSGANNSNSFTSSMEAFQHWYSLQMTEPLNMCKWPLILAMCLTGIGGGSVRANMSPFGADQVRHDGPEMIRTFFNWFYWSINIGSLIALVCVSYVQQNINFFYGFCIVAASLVLGLLVFTCGRCAFLTREPVGSVLPNTFKIIIEAFKRRKLRKEASSRRVRHMVNSCPKITFLDMSKKRHGGSFPDSMVEDVKSLKKVIGIFFLLVPYWIVYYQMQSTFTLQGLHMRFTMPDPNPNDKTEPFSFPVAWLSICDVIVVIMLLPILDRFVYPWLTKRGHSITLYHRILIGMIFSMLSMVAAGVLEYERNSCYTRDPGCRFNQTVMQGNVSNTYQSANMWIFYQIPQYVLIGISEVLASVAALEFAYSHAPKSMQGLIMGLYCLSSGIGCLCGSALIAIFSIPDFHLFTNKNNGYINNGKLWIFFFFIGGIQLVATIIFSCLNVREFLSSPGALKSGHGSGYGTRGNLQRRNSGTSSGDGY